MLKKLTIISILLILVGASVISVIQGKRKTLELDASPYLQTLTKETKVLDAHLDHNQALDVAEYAIKKGVKIPSILINFDTHSDIYIATDFFSPNKQREIDVESWINELIHKNPNIDEIYWVIPDEEATSTYIKPTFNVYVPITEEQPPRTLYGNATNKDMNNELYFFLNPIDKKSYVQEYLLDTKTGYLNENPNDEELVKKWFNKPIKDLRKIKVVTCIAKNLPDFEGKEVFLSIDADYTSNNGFDTMGRFAFFKSPSEINETFYMIFKTLVEKNVKPTIFTLSLSPQYLPEPHHDFMARKFSEIINITGLPDAIQIYTREYKE